MYFNADKILDFATSFNVGEGDSIKRNLLTLQIYDGELTIYNLEEKEKKVAAEDLCAELTITRRMDSKIRFDTLRNAGFSASVAAANADADKVAGVCPMPTLYLGGACFDQLLVEMKKE